MDVNELNMIVYPTLHLDKN